MLLVVFGFFDCFQIVFKLFFGWIVFGFVWVIVGFVWLFFGCVGCLGSLCCFMLFWDAEACANLCEFVFFVSSCFSFLKLFRLPQVVSGVWKLFQIVLACYYGFMLLSVDVFF